jgi:predicted Zn-dependent peptidase
MFKKSTLKNGLRLILAPMPSSQTLTVLVLFATGSKYETKNINGLSHFLEHMFFKGTKKRPDTLAIAETLDRVGGRYNAFTSKEYTGYWAKVANDHLVLALDWVSDILLNSKFEAAEIEKERGVITEEINMYLDTPMVYVTELWEELLYGDQPAGWQVIGTKENIAKMSRAQFLDYFKTHYRTKNAIVCLAGKFDKTAHQQVEKFFGRLPKGLETKKLAVKEKQSKPEALVFHKETDQTHLCLGVRAYDIWHKDRYALAVLANILGGMMSSRLWISVRERKGLAYYVRTTVENYTDSGYLVTQAGVAHSRAEEAISEILKEYQKIRDKKIGAAEIKKAKDNLKGITHLTLETSDELASWVAGQEILKKEILTPEQVFAKVDKVTAADLQRVARDILQPAKLNLALIGPFKEKEKFERLLKI